MGDNGYACKRYLLTPVINPTQYAERNYNVAHKRTRNIIERLFGIWKQRFPCLKRVLSTKLETSVAVICAVAVLHNVGIIYNDNFEHNVIEEEEVINDNIIDNPDADALHYRHAFIIRQFGN